MYDIPELIIPPHIKDYFTEIGLPIELLDVYYIFEMGAQKYARNDWATNPEAFKDDKRFPSGMRHKVKYYYGKSPYDTESTYCHLLHDICNSTMQYAVDKRNGKIKLKKEEVSNNDN